MFGIADFRAGQHELIETVLQRRDALGILPTNGGKSLVLHLASLFLPRPGQTDKLEVRGRPRFRDKGAGKWHLRAMAPPNAAAKGLELQSQADLEDELRRAEQEFARGDFIELTVEDLDRSMAAGEWPWAPESSE